ncbi:hypothetical protein ACO0K9_01980 [Undibacterium sp. Ji50W]|uniref:hypothetical protein n=1 Tax=Undibacterium sp. Ji50W TaxID=3413041 RepID=UPI003BF1E1BA
MDSLELWLPVGVTSFKGETFTPPKVWAEPTYKNLYCWSEILEGGHFAAMEQPAQFVCELQGALCQFR